MAYADCLKNSPLERLEYDEIRERVTPVEKYWTQTLGIVVGALTTYTGLKFYQRPLYAALPVYAFTMSVGYAIGAKVNEISLRRAQTRMAMMRHYIELHPEDFPPYPPRVKFANVLQPWIPIRPGS